MRTIFLAVLALSVGILGSGCGSRSSPVVPADGQSTTKRYQTPEANTTEGRTRDLRLVLETSPRLAAGEPLVAEVTLENRTVNAQRVTIPSGMRFDLEFYRDAKGRDRAGRWSDWRAAAAIFQDIQIDPLDSIRERLEVDTAPNPLPAGTKAPFQLSPGRYFVRAVFLGEPRLETDLLGITVAAGS